MKAIEECLPPEREEDIEKTGWLSNWNTCGRVSLCEHTNPSWINEDGVIWPLNRGFPRSRTPSPLSFLSAEKKTEKHKGIFFFETPRRMGMTEFGKNHPFLFQRRRAAHLHYLRWRILTHATAVKRNLRSLVDRHEPGESESLSVLSADLTSFHRKPISYSAYKKKWWTIFSALFDLP